LVISVAITGGVHGKESNPNLPETAEEQVQQAYDCYNAGASFIHIHARVPGKPWDTSTDPEVYRNVNRLVRQKCPDIIINNSTGAGQGADKSQALAPVSANPESCSLDMGPLATRFPVKKRPEAGRMEDQKFDLVTPFGFGYTETFAKAMLEKGVRPEIEVWHPGMWSLVQNLIDKNLVKPPYLIQLVFGFDSGLYPTPKDVVYLAETAPKPSSLCLLGVGPWQTPIVTLGILMGMNVRTGMEDNLYMGKGQLVQSNVQLVEKVVRLARELGREIATPKQAREMLGFPPTPSKYD
jgi:3-keto-5-aminohexanoate cleavage enzyme